MKKKLASIAFLILMLSGLLVPFINLGTNHIREVKGQQTGPTIFEDNVPVRGTYLFADDYIAKWDDNGDGVNEEHRLEAPLIVDLAAAGFKPGDEVLITTRGKLYYSMDGDKNLVNDGQLCLWGVFSSSNTLLWDRSVNGEVGPLHRVPGAIDYGKPCDTGRTYKGFDTDIPEDFLIEEGLYIAKIPPGAAFLMLSCLDSGYCGNGGWIKVWIEKDTDADGLWDSWETNGIDINRDGTIDITLVGADYLKKDIYVEIDYMQGHRPDQSALDDVVAAFRSCPDTVENGPINLHPEVDQTTVCPYYEYLRLDDAKDFKAKAGFGTYDQQQSANSKYILLAKKYAYHYCLFAHKIEVKRETVWTKTNSGGIGEVFGDDFMVSLGAFTNGVGSRAEQAAVFMHELGHNLGLLHGGDDEVNYKPNYLSIMNYLFQLDGDPLHNRPLTYSSAKLRTLNESGLDETTGLNAANWDWTVYSAFVNTTSGPKYVPLAVSTLDAIDWNNDGDEEDAYTQANINNFPQWSYTSPDDEVLYGFDDWANLKFRFMDSENFQLGLDSLDIDDIEITWEIAQAMVEDAKNMVGGPTGPVQILDVNVPAQPSPEEQNGSSLIDTNILVIVAIVVIVLIGMGALLVWRKRRKQSPP